MKFSLIFLLLIPSLVRADWFSSPIDVEMRMRDSWDSIRTHYTILGTSSGGFYARYKNPIKKGLIVYTEPIDFLSVPWSSASFEHEVNCNSGTIKIVKAKYFSEKYGKGKILPDGMYLVDRDIVNFQLPKPVIEKVFFEACVSGL